MSVANVDAQELSSFYIAAYCGNAASALLVYDWLLSLDQEIKYIWNGRSRATGSLLVYTFSRYVMLIQSILGIASNFPMSDMSCRANIWTQAAVTILSPIPVSAFSALRAYALSDRSIWMVAIIILLALPPTIMPVIQSIHISSENLPSPFNCNASVPLSPALSMSVFIATRASQLAAELLVVGVTWWYSYQWYQIRGDVKLGNTVSSLLLYNGSLYFLFFATLYSLDIIFRTAPVPEGVLNVDSLMVIFYDPITSILVCRFVLSLRQFDNALRSSATFPGISSSQLRDHTTSMVLPFGAQQNESLPAFISSFAHPVHVTSDLPEVGGTGGATIDDRTDWGETHPVASTSRLSPPGPSAQPSAAVAV